MAHLPPHLAQPAVYSPSVARAAASTAKDWSHVDAWLKAKFQGQKLPPFERNADTLKALLTLAAHNETADEERHQLSHLESAAVDRPLTADHRLASRQPTDKAQAAESAPHTSCAHAQYMLQALENGLGREGKVALEAMASMAVELRAAYPTPAGLASNLVGLQTQSLELDQTTERVALLQAYLDRQSPPIAGLLRHLGDKEYRSPANLSKRNLELQRQVEAMTAQLLQVQQQTASLESTIAAPTVTVEELRKDEQDYLDVLAKKKDLDARVKAFAGLPPDVEAARLELEALRGSLRAATQKRDAGWEGLVERESPFKPRSRRPA